MKKRRHDKTGRSTGKTSDRRAEKLDSPRPPFIWLSKEMLESPAWSAMSDRALKMLLRIGLEHMRHGGVENARLKVTFNDFVSAGIWRQSVRDTEAELIALGFIERRFDGRKAWGVVKGQAAQFRLTHLCVRGDEEIEPPTNAWARFKSVDEARAAVATALVQEAKRRLCTQNIDSCTDSAPGELSALVHDEEAEKCGSSTGASADSAPGKKILGRVV